MKTVVTGQQLGLLGGPLYTAYKIAGAIDRARALGGRAVYWLETNDADFAEIRDLHFLDAAGSHRTLRWKTESGGRPCGDMIVDESLRAVIREFFDTIEQTGHTAELRSLCEEAYAPGRDLGTASAVLLQRLYGDALELFDPRDPSFREESQELLRREAESTRPGDQCNCFFIDHGGRRQALFRKEDGSYRDRKYTVLDLPGLTLVPSLKTRSVLQDQWFHTHSYIAGPGELAYHRDLGPQYRKHRVRRARLVPRMRAVIADTQTVQAAERIGFPPGRLAGMESADFDSWVRSHVLPRDYRKLREEAVGESHRFLRRLRRLGLDTGDLEKELYRRMGEITGYTRKRDKDEYRGELEAAAVLGSRVFPGGKLQERTLTVMEYCNRYGTGFLDWLQREYRSGKQRVLRPEKD